MVRLRTDPHAEASGESETAEFVVPIEAAAIDAFVQGLDGMSNTVGAAANLDQAT